jgi:hypothetical protein
VLLLVQLLHHQHMPLLPADSHQAAVQLPPGPCLLLLLLLLLLLPTV